MFRQFYSLVSVLLLASLIPATSVFAQQDHDFSELEKVALAELKETNTPGAAVVVVSGDRAVFVKGFGVANIETGVPVTTDTLVRIGGMSKFLVATVLVSLAEEGKLDLDVPISRYVKGLSRKLSRVTAQQLLSETAGVKEDHLQMSLYDDAALGKIVRSWGDDWLIAEPGRIQSGSHPGYAIAGLLIEEVAGKPFADVMNERLFSPLGMARSTYRPLVAFTYSFSQGHRSVSGQKTTIVRPFGRNSVGWPSYSLFSTASDLSHFLIAFLNGGKLDGRQVISQSVIAKLANAPMSGPTVGEEKSYGLASARHGSHHVLTGNYTWAGMRPLIRIAPDDRFAIIFVSNGGSRPLTKTVETAMQMFLGSPGKPETIPSESLPMTQAEMTGCVGTYENEEVMTLFLKDGSLFIRDDTPPAIGLGRLTGAEGLPVTKVGEKRFSVSPTGASEPTLFTLIAGDKGRIEYLRLGSRALKRR